MVIISVSNRSEKAMLRTVRMLRRLLRNALLVMKRVRVMQFSKGYQLRSESAKRRSESQIPSLRTKRARMGHPHVFIMRSLTTIAAGVFFVAARWLGWFREAAFDWYWRVGSRGSELLPAWRRRGGTLLWARCGGGASSRKLPRSPIGWSWRRRAVEGRRERKDCCRCCRC